MKSVVFVSVLLVASAAVLAAPAPEPEPYGDGDTSDSAATTTTSAESASSPGNTRGDSHDGIRDKKSAPCDEIGPFKSTASSSSSSTASQTSDKSQDSNLEERTKGTKLMPTQVHSSHTKTKFVKVPVQLHDTYSHGHYAYGGHRADEWSQQTFGSPDQERYAYVNGPEFQAFQRASQQQLAAAMQAEMAARAEAQARMEELRLATEREAEITAREQALASEQQLEAATMQAEMATMARAQAQARAVELAQQEKFQQAQEQALEEARRMEIELAEKAAIESTQQMQMSQDTSARSAYAEAYSPSVPLGGYSRGGAAVGYFPRAPVSNNCGGIPLLFGCSPTLVRGNLVGGHGYGGGGAYSASGFGYGSGYQLGPWIGGGLGYGGGYRQAGDSEDSSGGVEGGKIELDLGKMNVQQRELLRNLIEHFRGEFNALNN